MRLLFRDGLICHICNGKLKNIGFVTLDHIRPKAHGGTNDLANLQLAHKNCNNRKGSEWLSQK